MGLWPPDAIEEDMSEAVKIEGHDHHDDHHHEPTFVEKWIFPLDHKFIGMQYLFTGMFMALFGGFFVYAFRMQLALSLIHISEPTRPY